MVFRYIFYDCKNMDMVNKYVWVLLICWFIGKVLDILWEKNVINI